MAVWVRIRLQPRRGDAPRDRRVEAAALVNSGFRPRGTQIMLPPSLAAQLGMWPDLPAGSTVRSYRSAQGTFHGAVIPGAVEVSVVTPNRTVGPVLADVLVNPAEKNVVLSDALGEALEIAILKLRQGVWAFSDEIGNPRASEPEPGARDQAEPAQPADG